MRRTNGLLISAAVVFAVLVLATSAAAIPTGCTCTWCRSASPTANCQIGYTPGAGWHWVTCAWYLANRCQVAEPAPWPPAEDSMAGEAPVCEASGDGHVHESAGEPTTEAAE